MLKKNKLSLLIATTVTFGLINTVELKIPTTNSQGDLILIKQEAYAKKSGGRSGGGSFQRRGSSSGSSGKSSGSSSSGSSSTTTPRRSSSSSTRRRDIDIDIEPNINAPSGGGVASSNSSATTWVFILFLLGFGSIAAILLFVIIKKVLSNSSPAAVINKERDNDIVTLSKLQVAFIAPANNLQSDLSDLSLKINTDTPEGLFELLQESVLLLLRNSDAWSHVLTSSQTLKIDQAEAEFNKLSLEQRSKFSRETLSNVKGKVSQKASFETGELQFATYIIVTLLIGTADDKPIVNTIHSTEELREALSKLATIRSDYLMTFELLWTPQDATESLTSDEFIIEYTDMLQLV